MSFNMSSSFHQNHDTLAEAKKYYLMLADIKVLEMSVLKDNTFDSIEITIDCILAEDLLPFNFKRLDAWLEHRKAPKHRVNIESLLSICGIHDLQGYIDITYALALTDNYWVKPIESDLTYAEVNLFDNPINEVVSNCAFDGEGLCGNLLSSTSPEFSTDGALAKCWRKIDGQIKLYKTGTSGFSNAGREPFSEYLSGQILQAINFKNYVTYDLEKFKGRVCSVCDIFTSRKESFVSAGAMGFYLNPKDLYDYYKSINATDYFINMLLFDGLTCNDDRHLGNFGFMYNSETKEILRPAPLFDNGQSLLPYITEGDFKDLNSYLTRKGPRIGNDFTGVVKNLLTSDHKKLLRKMVDFEFSQHPKYKLEHIKILNKLVQLQVRKLLS